MNVRWTAALAAIVALVACGSPRPAPKASKTPGAGVALTGAGSTFIKPLMLEWISRYQHVVPAVSINYQGIGSGGGVQQFLNGSIDFAATDAYLTDAEVAATRARRSCGAVHIPMVHGAVAVVFNLSGVRSLTLDGPTLASIYLGRITFYDDAALRALNPGVSLPHRAIAVVHRSDASGTTSIFTKFLAASSADWRSKVGPGAKDVPWPLGVGGQGNDGVASAVEQNPGAIGYVELAYAIENHMTTAAVRNRDGRAVLPSVESTQAALETISVPDDLRFDVEGVGGAGYPIVGTTWVVAWRCGYSRDRASALKAFLAWDLEEGDAQASALHYAPLGASLKAKALGHVEEINSRS